MARKPLSLQEALTRRGITGGVSALGADAQPGGIFAIATGSKTGRVLGPTVTNTPEGRALAADVGSSVVAPSAITQTGLPPPRTRLPLPSALGTRTRVVDGQEIRETPRQRFERTTGPIQFRKREEARQRSTARQARQDEARVAGIEREDELAAREQTFALERIAAQGETKLDIEQEKTRGKLGVQELKSAADKIVTEMNITDAVLARRLEQDMNTANNTRAEDVATINANADVSREKIRAGTDSPADRAQVELDISTTIGQLALAAAKLPKIEFGGTAALLRRQIQKLENERAELQGGAAESAGNAGLVDKNNNGSVVDEAQAEIAEIDRALLDNAFLGQQMNDAQRQRFVERKKLLQGIK